MSLRTSGEVSVDIRYEPARDEYRGDVSWPEVAHAGARPERAIRHHKIVRLKSAPVLMTFTDVRQPGGPDKLDRAAATMIRESLPAEVYEHLVEWHKDSAGLRRMNMRRSEAVRAVRADKKEHLFRILDIIYGNPTNQRRGFPSEDAAAFSAATLLEGRTKAKFSSRVEIVKEWYRR